MGGNRGLAQQVRTGLEDNTRPTLRVVRGSTPKDPMEQVQYGKTVRQHVREFGALIALVFIILSAVKVYHTGVASLTEGALIHKLTFASFVFAILCSIAPRIMVYPWRAWMALGHGLGFVMSYVMVSMAWVLMFVPMGLFLKLLGKRTVDTSFKSSAASYWEVRTEKSNNFKLLERQF